MGAFAPFFLMNGTHPIHNYNISIRFGNVIEPISVAIFAVICDSFLFETICDIVEESSSDTIAYTAYKKGFPFMVHLVKKQN